MRRLIMTVRVPRAAVRSMRVRTRVRMGAWDQLRKILHASRSGVVGMGGGRGRVWASGKHASGVCMFSMGDAVLRGGRDTRRDHHALVMGRTSYVMHDVL